ncbi:MAG TPA: hypothetical protein P5567_07910 [Kiritimatiellia bacterium]|nr:hypothetical protein [Kiritimatiellia bacterium]HRZ12364.1 hypothetical protein [Kiritimatiellia bacterium]HSA17878.1 hypothetical protein [Kiritimatiellia bacterium]
MNAGLSARKTILILGLFFPLSESFASSSDKLDAILDPIADKLDPVNRDLKSNVGWTTRKLINETAKKFPGDSGCKIIAKSSKIISLTDSGSTMAGELYEGKWGQACLTAIDGVGKFFSTAAGTVLGGSVGSSGGPVGTVAGGTTGGFIGKKLWEYTGGQIVSILKNDLYNQQAKTRYAGSKNVVNKPGNDPVAWQKAHAGSKSSNQNQKGSNQGTPKGPAITSTTRPGSTTATGNNTGGTAIPGGNAGNNQGHSQGGTAPPGGNTGNNRSGGSVPGGNNGGGNSSGGTPVPVGNNGSANNQGNNQGGNNNWNTGGNNAGGDNQGENQPGDNNGTGNNQGDNNPGGNNRGGTKDGTKGGNNQPDGNNPGQNQGNPPGGDNEGGVNVWAGNQGGDNNGNQGGIHAGEQNEPQSPVGGTTIVKGWAKNSTGTTKVTETTDSNGNVVSVTHTDYDSNGNVISTTTYPASTGEGQTDTNQDGNNRGNNGQVGGNQTGNQMPAIATSSFLTCAICGKRFEQGTDGVTSSKMTPLPFNSKLSACENCAKADYLTAPSGCDAKEPGKFCLHCGSKFKEAVTRVKDDDSSRAGYTTEIVCPNCGTVLDIQHQTTVNAINTPDKWSNLETSMASASHACPKCGQAMTSVLEEHPEYLSCSPPEPSKVNQWRDVCPNCGFRTMILSEAEIRDLGNGKIKAETLAEDETDQSLSVADMRKSEAESLKDTEAISISRPEVLSGMIGQQNERMAKKYDTGLEVMGNNTAIDKASNSGNETLKNAKITLNAGGEEAVKIGTENQHNLRIAQNNTKNILLNGVVNGVNTGVKTAAGHLGENLGGKAGDSIFGGNNKGTNTGNTGRTNTGTDHPPVGPQTVNSSSNTNITSYNGHNYEPDVGGETNTETTTSSSTVDSGPVCVICGGPAYMEFDGVGWLCHDCEKKGYDYPGGPSGNTGTSDGTSSDTTDTTDGSETDTTVEGGDNPGGIDSQTTPTSVPDDSPDLYPPPVP